MGRLAAVLHEHEECSTLPRFLPKLGEKGLRHMDFKLAGGEEGMRKAKTLVETGIASPIPRNIRGQKVRPIRRVGLGAAPLGSQRGDRRAGGRRADRG